MNLLSFFWFLKNYKSSRGVVEKIKPPSSIVLNEKISVSNCRKTSFSKTINNKMYKFYPVYYPRRNGIFNIDKAIEDIKWIIDTEL